MEAAGEEAGDAGEVHDEGGGDGEGEGGGDAYDLRSALAGVRLVAMYEVARPPSARNTHTTIPTPYKPHGNPFISTFEKRIYILKKSQHQKIKKK